MIRRPMIRRWGRSALLSMNGPSMTCRSWRWSAFPSTTCRPMMIDSIQTLNRARESVVVPRVGSEILIRIEPLWV